MTVSSNNAAGEKPGRAAVRAGGRLRVAVAIPDYGLIGGAESAVFEMTERLAVLDEFDIHVLANRWHAGSGRVTFHKVPVIAFPRWLKPVSFAAFAQRIIGSFGFDLVHAHERLFATDLFTFHGIPHVTWTRKVRQKPMSLFDLATARVERRGLLGSGLRCVMPVSSLARDALLRVYDLPGDRVRVQHPGIDPGRFDGLDRTVCRTRVRQRHGIAPDDLVVLFVGMNFEVKRLALVMEGVARYHGEAVRPIRLLVVGKGNTARYRALAGEMGIGDRIVFAGATREVAPYYLAADIFAMPSVFDTFGLAVLEAMAAGLPVVISDRVGAKDLVDEGQTGTVLQNRATADAVAAAIGAMADGPRRQQMGARAAGVARRHSWERVVAAVADLYRPRGV